jgi:hypothetical protein
MNMCQTESDCERKQKQKRHRSDGPIKGMVANIHFRIFCLRFLYLKHLKITDSKQLFSYALMAKKVKISLLQAVEAHRVARG